MLQRRARRRLVGAIALVVFVVIVFPLVLDNEPKPIGQDLVIQIPSQDAARFKTPVLAPVAPGSADTVSSAASERPAKAQAKAVDRAPAAEGKISGDAAPASKSSVPATAPKRATSQPAAAEETGRARAALEGKGAWIVRLGAFSDPKNVKQLLSKLTGAGMKNYTEIVKGPLGEQTRVRLGPFDTQAEAESAGEKLKSMGIAASAASRR